LREREATTFTNDKKDDDIDYDLRGREIAGRLVVQLSQEHPLFWSRGLRIDRLGLGLLSAAVRRGFSVNNDSKDEKQTVVSFFFFWRKEFDCFMRVFQSILLLFQLSAFLIFRVIFLLFQLLIFSRFFFLLEVLKID
jgi:hypothetical protein